VVARRVLPVFVALSLLPAMATSIVAPVDAAQGTSPCETDTAPSDALKSAAFGLTRSELDKLYGPGNATQTGWLYEFDGFDLTLDRCDLILHLDPNGKFADIDAARDLVRTLLPEDAVLAGTWPFGTLQTAPQDGEEWISAELAARYRLMGEPRTGSIFALYTYAGNAYTPGNVDHIELRSADIPES
jgi:hypothetical protein